MKLLQRFFLLSLLSFIFCIAAQAQVENWKRVTLTGTGLTIEHPGTPKLLQDKPDPFIQDQVAYIFWGIDFGEVFGTLRYEKRTKERLTPRQKMDSTAKLFSENGGRTVSRVTDKTFGGQPAALFEEEFIDKGMPKRRLMLCFGSPGELWTVNVTYPINSPTAKRVAERIYNSAQREGTTAKAVPQGPPADWRKYNWQTLYYETPIKNTAQDCSIQNISVGLSDRKAVCYKWGLLTAVLTYSKYQTGARNLPVSARAIAEDYIRRLKEINKTISVITSSQSGITSVTNLGADAVKVSTTEVIANQIVREDTIFIKKGYETWEFQVRYFERYDYQVEAAKRIISSLSFTGTTSSLATSTQKPVPSVTYRTWKTDVGDLSFKFPGEVTIQKQLQLRPNEEFKRWWDGKSKDALLTVLYYRVKTGEANVLPESLLEVNEKNLPSSGWTNLNFSRSPIVKGSVSGISSFGTGLKNGVRRYVWLISLANGREGWYVKIETDESEKGNKIIKEIGESILISR